MREPAASLTLRELADTGWIAFDGVRDGIDCWQIAEKGRRLAATKLIKRFPIKEGRASLEKIIDAARAINLEFRSSRRITALKLFGSVLTGPDDGDAGDIDLVVEIGRRGLPEKTLQRLEAEEEKRAPPGMLFRIDHRRTEILRAIKKVSQRISIHDRSDLEALGAPFQTIYRYDAARDAELDVLGAIEQISPPAPERTEERPRMPVEIAPPVRPLKIKLRENAVVTADHVDLDGLLKAQHLWTQGLPIQEISAACRLPENATTAYLSRFPNADRLSGEVGSSLRQTIWSRRPTVSISASISCSPRSRPIADVYVFCDETYDRLARVRRMGRSDAMFSGAVHHFSELEAVSYAAWAYADKLAKSARDLGFDIFCFVPADDEEGTREEGGFPRFAELQVPMQQTIERLHAQAGGQWEPYRYHLALDFFGGKPLTLCDGFPFRWPYNSTRVLKRDAPDLWPLIAPFGERFPHIRSGSDRVRLFVRSDRNDSYGDDDY